VFNQKEGPGFSHFSFDTASIVVTRQPGLCIRFLVQCSSFLPPFLYFCHCFLALQPFSTSSDDYAGKVW
jgi:hypothetical protein